ncbi:MAG: hypothetical protein H6585_14425 [Flavobacteriales bacterium]|nr:hypothetical protein [Flavobacteriales bacterium]MCB9449525.1 hypothetical protein [Flavobacteriales bacterium]
MKHIILFFALMLSVISSQAQPFAHLVNGSFNDNEIMTYTPKNAKWYREKKIKGVNEFRIRATNGRIINKRLALTQIFDSRGLNTGIDIYSDKGILINHYDYAYNDSLRLTLSSLHKKGSPKWRREYDYENQTRLTSSHSLAGKKNKLQNTWQYTYLPDGEKAEASLYNRHGKLVTAYSFLCDTKGKKEDLKDTVQLCREESYTPDGLRLVVHMQTFSKNKSIRQLYYYRPDQVLVKYESYGNEGELIARADYTYADDDQLIKILRYTARHKITTTTLITTASTADGKVTQQDISNDRNNKTQTYISRYNAQGLIVESQYLANGKSRRHRQLEYTFYE